jgi:ABC-type nitrate/sulfonate/bicarbonate transport system permease component
MVISTLAALAAQTRPISRAIALGRERPPSRPLAFPSLVSVRGAATAKIGEFFWRYGAIALFVLCWQFASQFSLVDPSVIPPFTTVMTALVHGFVDGALFNNMLVSLRRSGIAFGIAVGLAIPLGLLMGSFRRFEDVVDSLLQLFRQTSALAIHPIFILLLGLGETSKIMLICWAALFPILLNTISGVKLVDRRLIEMARVFGASRADVFKRVVLPAATPLRSPTPSAGCGKRAFASNPRAIPRAGRRVWPRWLPGRWTSPVRRRPPSSTPLPAAPKSSASCPAAG